MRHPIASSIALIVLFATTASSPGQEIGFDKAKEKLRESLRQGTLEQRIAAVEPMAATKDGRGVEEFVAAIRQVEQVVRKVRADINKSGTERRDIWKVVDEQNSKGRGVSAGTANPAVKKEEELQKKLAALTAEQNAAEAFEFALMDGLGRLLTALDPTERAKQVTSLAGAAQKATSTDDKILFAHIFGASVTPESRDALIEMATLGTDAAVRTAAVDELGRLGDTTTVPILTKALTDEMWTVKIAAARALGGLPSVEGTTALAEALAGSEGRAIDELVEALEDISGVTFFDNGQLWKDWASKEGEALKQTFAALDGTDPVAKTSAINSIAAKGTLAGVRRLMVDEGVHPFRDVTRRVKSVPPPPPPPDQKPDAMAEQISDIRRGVIGKTISTRPKLIRDRATTWLFLEPMRRLADADDAYLLSKYIRLAGGVSEPTVRAMLTRFATLAIEPIDDKMSAAAKERAESQKKLKMAALDALGFQDDDDAALPLAKILHDDHASKEERLLAIKSLARLERQIAIQPMIEAIALKGEIGEAALKALKDLTGSAPGNSRDDWNKWWQESGKSLSTLVKKKHEQAGDDKEPGEKKGGTNFYGITTRSKRLVYVLDVSGSMNEVAGLTGQISRIQAAKKELIASIRSLPEDANFNIIFYDDTVSVWKPKMVTATKEVKAEAVKWTEEVKAVGATNIFDALEKAFEMAGRGTKDSRNTVALDTIYLLSDGQPNRGRLIEPSTIISEMSRMNDQKKVRIHTIGIGKDHNAEFMRRLAALTGGSYVAR